MIKIFYFIVFFLLMNGLSSAYAGHKKPDEYYMQIALQLAKQNPKAPFAALIVDNATGKILARGLNQGSLNPTFHGEIIAINNYAKQHPRANWSTVSLYTTAEPCPMCQSAIIWSGIPRVVFATSINYLKTHGWNQIDITAAAVNQQASFYKGTLTGGILADKSNVLFKKM